jgi:uncharacterized protein YbjQ (UPF0145 family)
MEEFPLIITSTDSVPNKNVKEILGVVRGNTVRAKHLGRDIMAGLKGIVGGEVKAYTELMTEAREEAFNRMVAEAEKLGADGILSVRFVTSMVASTMSELLVFGTAVKLS